MTEQNRMARLGMALVGGALCVAAVGVQESGDARADVRRPQARREAPAEARQDREGARSAREQANAASRHAALLRSAHEVYREAGWERAEAAMRRALHAAELEAKAAEARAGAPGPEDMVELLGQAAALQRERGREEAAQALNGLARRYRARLDAGGAARRERDGEVGGLEELEGRIEIVRMAVAAHAEAGRADAANLLRRFLRVAEMQRAGASGTEMSRVLDGLDLQAVVQSLREAGALYRRWDRPERAQACAALARFYTQRWSLSSVPPINVAPPTDRAQPDARPPSAEPSESLRRMAQRMERLEAELQELKAALRRMAQDQR